MVPMDKVDNASIFSAGPATLSCLRLSSYTRTDSSKSRGALMKLTFTGRVAILYTCKVTSTLLSSSSVYSKFTSVPPEV